MNCRQRASAQHDHDIHLNLARPLCYLFYRVCVCDANNTNGLIFILGESDVMEVLNLLLAAEVEGNVILSVSANCEVRGKGEALCNTLFCLLECHLPK